jgi:tetratricopeptide (TPR) repeat protein
MFHKLVKLALIIILSYQTPLYSKSTSFNELNAKDLTNYFSGMVAFENKENSDALKFFNSSKILINKHDPYLKRYIYSLVLENKVSQSINVIKNRGDENNINFFDAYLLLIIDSLKKNDFKKAEKYLVKITKLNELDRLHPVITGILKNFIYTFNKKEILYNNVNFGNISLISQAFQRCYLKKDTTRSSFLNLINNPNGDYSRYKFFYANFLIANEKVDEVKDIFEEIEFIESTLLLSQGKIWIENNEYQKFTKIFSCSNHNDIISEFLFLIANLYSSEKDLNKSNFYSNLSYYLNPKFKFNLALIVENYYENNEYKKVKKIIQNFNDDDQFYYWFRTKKEAQIIIEEEGTESGVNFITSKFKKIEKPNLKILFDIANFYKNSKKYEKAVEYYSKIISILDEDFEIKSELLYRRGSSYERLKNFKKSDEDFINSLNIDPDNAYVLNYLAYSWLERDHKIDQAMDMLKKAYLLKNDDPYIIDSIGWAYYLIDNYVEAEKYLKRAVELMPDDPIVNDHYGDILWKLNRKLQARYFWKNVLRFDDSEEKLKQKVNNKLVEGLKKS